MKIRQRLLVGTLLLLAGISSASAGGWMPKHPGQFKFHRVAAPEIDAAAGGSAIALLGGMLFLMKERRRRNQGSDSEK